MSIVSCLLDLILRNGPTSDVSEFHTNTRNLLAVFCIPSEYLSSSFPALYRSVASVRICQSIFE